MSSKKTYVIGRDNSRIRCDIYTPKREDSVSRQHLELTVTADGKFYINDINSTGGTFVLKNRQWERVSQCYVGIDQPVRLGEEFETTVRKLLAMKEPDAPTVDPDAPSGEPEWDPETGEVIYK